MDLAALSGVAAAQTQRADKEENKLTPQPPAMQPQVQQTTAEISPQAQQMAATERSLGQRFDVQNLLDMLGEQADDSDQASRMGGLFELFNAMDMQQG